MSVLPETTVRDMPPVELVSPAEQSSPVVFASPHSGVDYPHAFVSQSRLTFPSLRRSEDSFVDRLFAAAPRHGAPLIRALFPRAFVDPNREPFELDPTMFEDELPSYANTVSPRVAAGLGTIAKVVANGEEIYQAPLRFADVKLRIEQYYRPYHEALRAIVTTTRARFGSCLLIDCHSMPSIGGPMERDAGRKRVDFVLGDCHGGACAPVVIEQAESTLQRLGFVVARNAPYSGGFVTQHYGRPQDGVHALQIEINRGLYMDEAAIAPGPAFDDIAARLDVLIGELCDVGRRIAPS